MIKKDKRYRTRDGREVRIYATDGPHEESVHGAIKDYFGKWLVSAWFKNGVNVYNLPSCDLIEVKQRIKRERWVNIYPRTESGFFKSLALANSYPEKRIACIKIEIDCEEGEGL